MMHVMGEALRGNQRHSQGYLGNKLQTGRKKKAQTTPTYKEVAADTDKCDSVWSLSKKTISIQMLNISTKVNT